MTYKVLTPYLLLLIIIQITVMEKFETPENLFPEEKQESQRGSKVYALSIPGVEVLTRCAQMSIIYLFFIFLIITETIPPSENI